MAALCIAHGRVLTNEMLDLYAEILMPEMSDEQIDNLKVIATKTTEFWPSPGKLLHLAGLPTLEEKREAAARADLDRVLSALHGYRRDSAKRERFMDFLEKQNEDPIRHTIKKFGGGSVRYGIEVLCQHPRFLRSNDEREETISLEISAVEKLEARWLAAWMEVRSTQ